MRPIFFNRSRKLAAACGLALPLFMIGCGGSSEGSTPATVGMDACDTPFFTSLAGEYSGQITYQRNSTAENPSPIACEWIVTVAIARQVENSLPGSCDTTASIASELTTAFDADDALGAMCENIDEVGDYDTSIGSTADALVNTPYPIGSVLFFNRDIPTTNDAGDVVRVFPIGTVSALVNTVSLEISNQTTLTFESSNTAQSEWAGQLEKIN